MGMSASQARFLSLTARKNNVEFEGQQINQQRTTLSNESASYYSELCNLTVPTPPSIDDFTKVSYSFNDGAMTNTLISLLPVNRNSADYDANYPYVVNYLEEWQDDYAIVPASSSLVEKEADGSYSIGAQSLRKAGEAPIEGADEYYDSLNSEQKAALLKNEEYLLSMVQEKTGDNGDFYIRYVKNTSKGTYEPYLYAESELNQDQKYNDKNLASIPCYSLGSTTKTQEVLHKKASIEKDSSGRYVAITIEMGTGTRTLRYNNQDEINDYKKTHTEPVQKDYQIPKNNQEEIDEYKKTHTEPTVENHTKSTTDEELKNIFITASKNCYDTAVSGRTDSSTQLCYKHVLAHLIDLNVDSDGNPIGYPKTVQTSTGNSIEIPKSLIDGSAIYYHKLSDDMMPVSNALKDGYTVDGTTYDVVAGAVTANASSDETTKLLSDYYIKSGNATEAQKLLSNYYVDSASGEIKLKNLRQKAIDILYAVENSVADYGSVMVPIIKTFQNDMTTFSLFDEDGYNKDKEEWDKNTRFKSWSEDDKETYEQKHKEWEEGIPEYRTWSEEEEYEIPSRTYQLTTSTTTDEDAYNEAMNQYNYDQHEYDNKIQTINSKLEIVQQDDKRLELKLKQLDTEENAISTEMDAVKKVISKNVENSFKTFNA